MKLNAGEFERAWFQYAVKLRELKRTATKEQSEELEKHIKAIIELILKISKEYDWDKI